MCILTNIRDPICMPLRIYVGAEDQHKLIGPINAYESILAIAEIKTGEGRKYLCNLLHFMLPTFANDNHLCFILLLQNWPQMKVNSSISISSVAN